MDADRNEIISKSIEAIKVCGITYSDNEELAYEKNITDKIMKLESGHSGFYPLYLCQVEVCPSDAERQKKN